MHDIIGDIHGHADELTSLLKRLGYHDREECFAHPDRKAIFVGDFIDRGPQIREVLRIVRPMVERGYAQAVIGNHEFNALAFHAEDADRPSGYLREHSDKNIHQHSETLSQVPKRELSDALEWFRTLPLWLKLDGIRVVHACWDDQLLQVIQTARGDTKSIDDGFLKTATDRESDLYHAVDAVLKGKELKLPAGKHFLDKDGHERTNVRVKWYESPARQNFADYSLPANTSDATLQDVAIPDEAVKNARPYDEGAPPVFFGHYWLKADKPVLLAGNVACVDYSVAKGGLLCAYRWSGEQRLKEENFVVA